MKMGLFVLVRSNSPTALVFFYDYDKVNQSMLSGVIQ